MQAAITGVTKSIVDMKFECPIIFFSTYLQYLPEIHQPWSEYTIFKNLSVDMFQKYASHTRSRVYEIVLYDNFGGKRKNKFFDIVLESTKNKKFFAATDGLSVLNLTHINDVTNAVIKLIEDQDFFSINQLYEAYSIYSKNTFTLRQLVSEVEEVLNISVPIIWGKLPYRSKEVFEFYATKKLLPSFVETCNIKNYILTN